MDFSRINWLAVLVAPLLGFVIGALWYGPVMGKAWMRASGVTPDQVKNASPAKTYPLVYILNLIASASLAMFIGPMGDLQFGAMAGFLTGLTFVSVGLGVTYLFESRPFSLLAINGAYQTIFFTAMGALLGAWR